MDIQTENQFQTVYSLEYMNHFFPNKKAGLDDSYIATSPDEHTLEINFSFLPAMLYVICTCRWSINCLYNTT